MILFTSRIPVCNIFDYTRIPCPFTYSIYLPYHSRPWASSLIITLCIKVQCLHHLSSASSITDETFNHFLHSGTIQIPWTVHPGSVKLCVMVWSPNWSDNSLSWVKLLEALRLHFQILFSRTLCNTKSQTWIYLLLNGDERMKAMPDKSICLYLHLSTHINFRH